MQADSEFILTFIGLYSYLNLTWTFKDIYSGGQYG